LERVEAFALRNGHFGHEIVHQIVHDEHVGACEESDDGQHEVLRPLVHRFPVGVVLGKINLFRRPNNGLLLLEQFPEVVVLYGVQNKTFVFWVGEVHWG
jgi:hypothetical protein